MEQHNILDVTPQSLPTFERRDLKSGHSFVPKDTSPIKCLRLLTHNIWNNDSYLQERLGAVIKNIKIKNPDVACLIDVSEQAYHILNNTLDKHYLLFQVFIDEGNKSGTVIFCNRHTIEIPEGSQPYYYDYPQGGRILGCELIHKESMLNFHVLATRLDYNPDNDHIREAQCDVIHNVVRKLDNYVVLGDFNVYHRAEKAEQFLNHIMNDVWIKMHCPSKLRYTYNGKTNPIIKNNEKIRNTRIYYRSKKDKFVPKSMSLSCIGMISDTVKLPPSPYYCLEAIIQIKEKNM